MPFQYRSIWIQRPPPYRTSLDMCMMWHANGVFLSKAALDSAPTQLRKTWKTRKTIQKTMENPDNPENTENYGKHGKLRKTMFSAHGFWVFLSFPGFLQFSVFSVQLFWVFRVFWVFHIAYGVLSIDTHGGILIWFSIQNTLNRKSPTRFVITEPRGSFVMSLCYQLYFFVNTRKSCGFVKAKGFIIFFLRVKEGLGF